MKDKNVDDNNNNKKREEEDKQAIWQNKSQDLALVDSREAKQNKELQGF